jgi:uncharacterized membrane protein
MRKVWIGPLLTLIFFALILHYLAERTWRDSLIVALVAAIVGFILNYLAYRKLKRRKPENTSGEMLSKK